MTRLIDIQGKRRTERRHKTMLAIAASVAVMLFGVAVSTPAFWTTQQQMAWAWWALAALALLPLAASILSIRRLHEHRVRINSPREVHGGEEGIDFDKTWRET